MDEVHWCACGWPTSQIEQVSYAGYCVALTSATLSSMNSTIFLYSHNIRIAYCVHAKGRCTEHQ